MAPPTRIAKFYHGTTLVRAQRIESASQFSMGKTYFGLGDSNRDLAEIFARRTFSKYPNEAGPALLLITMEEPAFEALRKQGLFRMLPFDAEDRPELRLRQQWVLEPAGVAKFNHEADDWKLIRM